MTNVQVEHGGHLQHLVRTYNTNDNGIPVRATEGVGMP